ncbi:MAG: deoxyribose-phosphate aldolase [Lachnospiraceae bacterium]|nr:deoxyribose-phosphate aldolase [Lachnospiraceae bacterium]
MTSEELAGYVDYTQLKAYASWEDLQKLCEAAIRSRTASVCIPPSYVSRIKEKYGQELNVCTVIGFPLGYQTSAVKELEAKQAVEDGASEVDMVVNLGDVKNGDFEKVTEEIRMIKQAVGNHTLKVIIETCYLTEVEKISLCHCVTQAGADFIKTSTGFGTKGAALEDVELFKTHIGPKVQIKAAGGIRTAEDMEQFIKVGCTRIGSSVLP